MAWRVRPMRLRFATSWVRTCLKVRTLSDRALAEVRRVLKPKDGFLYVLEPMLTGSLEALYRLFHDETAVRVLAYDAFVDEVTGTTYNDFSREMLETPEVEALFESGRTEDGYVFTQHTRVNLYQKPRP